MFRILLLLLLPVLSFAQSKIDLDSIDSRYIDLSKYINGSVSFEGHHKGDRLVFSNAVDVDLVFDGRIETTHAEDAIAFAGPARNLTISGKLRLNGAITFWDVMDTVEITGMRFIDAHTGIRATQDFPHAWVSIHDNNFIRIGFEGVYIGPSYLSEVKSVYVRIFDNKFYKTGWDAAQVGNCTNCMIESNLIISPATKAEKWQDWAITVNPGSQVFLRGNTIIGSRQKLQCLDSRCFWF